MEWRWQDGNQTPYLDSGTQSGVVNGTHLGENMLGENMLENNAKIDQHGQQIIPQISVISM